MDLFVWLPKAYRFCGCTRNLKCACYIIIFLGMLTSIHKTGLLAKPACDELFEASSPVRLPAEVFRWIFFVSEMILMSSCFAFMLGIFWSLPITADIFISCALITCFISIVYGALIIVQEHYTNCRWYYSQIFHIILYIIMWCHFTMIVNTYKQYMYLM